jgi:hypothetical protein
MNRRLLIGKSPLMKKLSKRLSRRTALKFKLRISAHRDSQDDFPLPARREIDA